jgi:hypothetical protein
MADLFPDVAQGLAKCGFHLLIARVFGFFAGWCRAKLYVFSAFALDTGPEEW